MAEPKINREDKDFENMSDSELKQWARNENIQDVNNKSRSELIKQLRKQNK